MQKSEQFKTSYITNPSQQELTIIWYLPQASRNPLCQATDLTLKKRVRHGSTNQFQKCFDEGRGKDQPANRIEITEDMNKVSQLHCTTDRRQPSELTILSHLSPRIDIYKTSPYKANIHKAKYTQNHYQADKKPYTFQYIYTPYTFELVILAACLLQEERQENKHATHASVLPKGLWPVLTLARFYLVTSIFLEKTLSFSNPVEHCVKGKNI